MSGNITTICMLNKEATSFDQMWFVCRGAEALVQVFHSYCCIVLSPAKPELPENYSEQAWDKLRQAIQAIHTQQPISYSLEELYQAVENMCSHKMASKLYDNLKDECRRHVQSLVPVFEVYPPSCTVVCMLPLVVLSCS